MITDACPAGGQGRPAVCGSVIMFSPLITEVRRVKCPTGISVIKPGP
jgi:hypothetical protein